MHTAHALLRWKHVYEICNANFLHSYRSTFRPPGSEHYNKKNISFSVNDVIEEVGVRCITTSKYIDTLQITKFRN